MKHETFLTKIQLWIAYLLMFLLPTQLGTFFFIPQSYIDGIRIDYLAPSLYLNDLIIIFLALISIIVIIRSNKLITLIKKTSVLFRNKVTIGIFILILVNIFFSLEPIIAICKFMKLFELVIVFLFIKNIKVPSKTILLIILFSTFLQLSLVTMQILNQGSMQGIWYFFGERSFNISTPGIAKTAINGIEIMRGYGTFSHPNSMAGFYLLLYGFVSSHKPFHKYQLLQKLLLSISLLLILFSFSKIAILGLLGLVVYTNFQKKTNCFLCHVSKIIVPIVLGGIFLTAVGDPDSFDKRLWLAQSAVQIIKEHIVFGVGFGNYLIAQSRFSIPYPYFFLQPVHNIFLLALAEMGIPLFLTMVYLIQSGLKKLSTPEVRNILLVIILFTGMFDHYWLTLQQNMLLIPVVFGLLQHEKV